MNKDVLVIAEQFNRRLNEVTFELLGKGRALVQALGGQLGVALLGHEVDGLVKELGAAARVWVADRPEFGEFSPDAYAAVLEGALKEIQPRLLLLGSTSVGLDLLGLLSARAGLPCLDNCIRLAMRDATLVATCQIYGGKVLAEVALPEETTLVAVVPGAFVADAGKLAGTPAVETLALPRALATARTTFRKLIEPPPGDLDITRAPILVAVGRGIKSADNLPQAQTLAELLDGAVCGSRPVIDQGWLPRTRQVGKSGMTVKPKLYLALGISGAPEHVEGMRGAELIVAINTDAQAPIFAVAHYGVVGDWLEILPSLTEEIRRRQGTRAA